jgi:hypothetical protein
LGRGDGLGHTIAAPKIDHSGLQTLNTSVSASASCQQPLGSAIEALHDPADIGPTPQCDFFVANSAKNTELEVCLSPRVEVAPARSQVGLRSNRMVLT